ncbi:hypothetical protein QN277_024993 [Acacia crassicarpa]|uniref:FBD domain-containing protein n=1 Tax=Acacia crassicarpa TaxID=499986 RepID=A0AAE1JH91_9FABA|nr:hypothetical protein QN277_024993 [Acacia crassicarpa]
MRDRISHIPDELLLHILSSKSLQTKDVVATSVLSKRWRSLWHSIPKLEFDDLRFGRRYESFLQFVAATLNLVDLKSVKMFVLKCGHFGEYYGKSCDKFDSWLNTVLKSKLEYLNLWFPIGFDFLIRVPLPSTIFKCSSIRILKLARVNVSDLSDVNLPSLKTLHLTNVEFPNPESLALLLSKCVRLEELLLLSLEFPDDEVTKLNIGKLHNLVIAFVPVELFSMEAISNVTFLRLRKHNVFGDYEFPTFPVFYNLSHLEIQNGWTSMFSCLPNFPKLETLIIHEGQGRQGLDWLMETSPDVPLCISSHLKTFALFDFCYLQSEFEIVRFIMKNATVLRSVIIWTGKYSSDEAVNLRLLEPLSTYPKCSQNCSVFVNAPVENLYQSVYSKLVSHKDFSY